MEQSTASSVLVFRVIYEKWAESWWGDWRDDSLAVWDVLGLALRDKRVRLSHDTASVAHVVVGRVYIYRAVGTSRGAQDDPTPFSTQSPGLYLHQKRSWKTIKSCPWFWASYCSIDTEPTVVGWWLRFLRSDSSVPSYFPPPFLSPDIIRETCQV